MDPTMSAKGTFRMGRGLLNSEIRELDLEPIARTWTHVVWSRGIHIASRLLFDVLLFANGFSLLYVMPDDMLGMGVGLGAVAIFVVAVHHLIHTFILAARNPAMQRARDMVRSFDFGLDLPFPLSILLWAAAAVDALRNPDKVVESVAFHRFLGEEGVPDARDISLNLKRSIPYVFGSFLATGVFLVILKIG